MVKGFTVVKAPILRALAGIPIEDAFDFTRGEPFVMVAADGVTRDCHNGVPLTHDFAGLWNARRFYPRPDPAQQTAQLFCERVIDAADVFNGSMTERGILHSFEFGNFAIRHYWEKRKWNVDYLTYDYPGCVASMAHVHSGKKLLTFGYICDAGVAVVNKDGDLKMKTRNEGPDTHDSYIWNTDELRGLTWRDAQGRATIRSIFRNNPDHSMHGPHTFGVLTGETAALRYVRTGQHPLAAGDSVFVYTDGLEHVIFDNGDIRGTVADAVRDRRWKTFLRLCKKGVRTEGTVTYETVD